MRNFITDIKTSLKNNLLLFIIMVFLGVLFLQRCWKNREEMGQLSTVITQDTVKVGSDTFVIKPKFGDVNTTWDSIYIKSPCDTNMYWKIMIGKK